MLPLYFTFLIFTTITTPSSTSSSFFKSKSFNLQLPPLTLSSSSPSITQGHLNSFSLLSSHHDFSTHPNITYHSSNTTTIITSSNTFLPINPGTSTITLYYNNTIPITSSSFTVLPHHPSPPSQTHLQKAEQLLQSLTLEQKIGQMFLIGFTGTSLPSTFTTAIEQYKFGNIIYFQENVDSFETLSSLTNAVQSTITSHTGVPAFISIDQEGGRVARLIKGGTHFISAMGISATNNVANVYELGNAMGKELYNYGINVDFTPVLDVNNNPLNPIIGIRSYSDNPIRVAEYGNAMYKGLNDSNIISCAKHFPGHGNTNVDSHIGLPTVNATLDELYQMEFAPFISAFSNGIDALMTTHIVFSAVDSEYPATLSKEVLTSLLRNTFHYEGVVFTDGMEMGAVTSKYGGYDNTALLAVNAGVDVLTYTTHGDNPQIAYNAILNAVKNGSISIERIDTSVKRILIAKSKYGVLDNWEAPDKDIAELLKANEALNQRYADESITLVKGEFNGFDKTKRTIIVSPMKDNTVEIDPLIKTNSFAEYACKYLQTNGAFDVCDIQIIDANMTEGNVSECIEVVKQYEQIVIAVSNVQTNGYTHTADFVNKVLELNGNDINVVVIALDMPYDIMKYNKHTLTTYICAYNYQRATTVALSRFLNGEITAKGVLPLNRTFFE